MVQADAVLGWFGMAQVGELTASMLPVTALLVLASWLQDVASPPRHVPLPQRREELGLIVRWGVLPDSTERDAEIRTQLEQQRRVLARTRPVAQGVAWSLAGLSVLVAVSESQPGQLLVAVGWLVLGRCFRALLDDRLDDCDVLAADLDARHPSGFAHG